MTDDDLADLARARGLADSYLDFRGQRREVSLETRIAILRAMGVATDDAAMVRAALQEARAGAVGTQVADGRCHEPAFLRQGARPWGLCVQLYTLRSDTNWGIGDFGDLARLAREAASAGADFIGLNPLHALFAADPAHCSPYSPSSRHCLNVLCISIEAVPDLGDCAEAVALVGSVPFQQELARLRALDLVDYAGVARAKLAVLRLLYRRFCDAELAAGTARGQAFVAFLRDRQATVGQHALFEALDAAMRERHGAAAGWRSWPVEYRDPSSPAVAAFATEAADEVTFHAWLQWIAESQLAGAQRVSLEAGMRIGLYGDYAVGAHPGGSETWAGGDAYCHGASIGAPPDALALRGQDWGLSPLDPETMRRDGLAAFEALMRSNMRHFGALRIDHVMSLSRLWWVPVGLPASAGGYVQYPSGQLFGSVARASREAQCLVIGEDLGTVPPEVGEAMSRSGILGYTVLYFERNPVGGFKLPADWRHAALASVTTHDLPSLGAWWAGSDIELRAQLGLYPQGQDLDELLEERARDREALLDAMAAAGVRPRWPVERFEPEFAAAVHALLASTRSSLVAVQAEDLLGMTDPVNVPGTSAEYANWRRKLTGDTAALLRGPAAVPVVAALQRMRPR